MASDRATWLSSISLHRPKFLQNRSKNRSKTPEPAVGDTPSPDQPPKTLTVYNTYNTSQGSFNSAGGSLRSRLVSTPTTTQTEYLNQTQESLLPHEVPPERQLSYLNQTPESPLAHAASDIQLSFTATNVAADICASTAPQQPSLEILDRIPSVSHTEKTYLPDSHILQQPNIAPPVEESTAVTRRFTLWDAARSRMRPDTKVSGKLGLGQECDTNLIKSIISEVQQRKEGSDDKRWFYEDAEGQRVYYFDTIFEQLNKYVAIGDVAIQHNPDIVALAWAGFRFILQVGTAYTDNMRSLADGLSSLIRIICCCDIYEKLYITSKKSDVSQHLANSIVDLYVLILEYLLYADGLLQKSTPGKIWESFLSGSKQKREEIAIKEKEVVSNAAVAENEAAAAGRSDQTEEIRNLEKLLHEMQTPLGKIQFEVDAMFQQVKKDRYITILGWLSKLPFASHHSYFNKHRHPGTGDWLLDHESYGAWKLSDKSSIFWLRGGPGCGKSYLASRVIDHILDEVRLEQRNGHAIAYFYCHYSEEGRNNPASILRTIIKQLCLSMGDDLIPNEILSVYRERERHGHSSGALDVGECKDLILKLCEGLTKTTIIIDALDECDYKERRALFCALADIAKKARLVKIFVTGRDAADIRQTLPECTSHYIEEIDNRGDINMYIEKEIERRSQPHSLGGVEKPLLGGNDIDPLFKNYIVLKLQERANGMFMWVQLQIAAICEEHTEENVRAALEALPTSLNETYDRILSKISESSPSNVSLSRRVLSWIFFAETPCSPETIIQSTAMKPGKGLIDKSQLRLKLQDILDVCQNLVVYDEKLDTLRFAHFSVQEYLRNHPEFARESGHARMVEICLKSFMSEDWEIEQLYLLWGLQNYSAAHWVAHYRLSGAQSTEMCVRFLKSPAAYKKWSVMALENRVFPEGISVGFSPLWLSCYYGLQPIVQRLSQDTSQINSMNPCGVNGETPLLCATILNKHIIVRTLLDAKGVDVNIADSTGDTALCKAAEGGHAEIVRMLLDVEGVDVRKVGSRDEPVVSKAVGCGKAKILGMILEAGALDMITGDEDHNVSDKPPQYSHHDVVRMLLAREGVDVEKPDINGKTPLMKAVVDGNLGRVRMLLTGGADVNADCDGYTPLSKASGIGSIGFVQVLLDAEGVDINKADTGDLTPLARAVKAEKSDIVRLLLAVEGVDVNKMQDGKSPPLSIAAENGNTEIVCMLLAIEEVDVNKVDYMGRTALCIAAANNNPEIVRILLDVKGVDVNKVEDGASPALSISVENRNTEIVKMLLGVKGVDVNKMANRGRPPLCIAAWNHDKEIVRMLLDAEGVDVNKVDYQGCTALIPAVSGRFTEIVQMLLAVKGVDVNITSDGYRTPLCMAVAGCNEDIVRMLLAVPGVDVNIKHDNCTALGLAAEGGNVEIVKMLLAVEGVDVNITPDESYTPLFEAVRNSRDEIVPMLLAVGGIDVNIASPSGDNPLARAVYRGSEKVVRMLVAVKGVDVNQADSSDGTPLVYAVSSGYTEIVRMLLATESVDVNKIPPYEAHSRTPLACAAVRSDPEILRLLLGAKGIDVHKGTTNGETPLSLAVRSYVHGCVRLLSGIKGIDVNKAQNDGSTTPLILAAERDPELVKILLAAEGIDVNKSRTEDGSSPLMVAVRCGNGDIVRILLEAAGIDVNKGQAEDGRPPLLVAVQAGNKDIVGMLSMAKGIDVNVGSTEDGSSPLMAAVKANSEEMVHILLAAEGVDANKPDSSGITPILYALKNGMKNMLPILRDAVRKQFFLAQPRSPPKKRANTNPGIRIPRSS